MLVVSLLDLQNAFAVKKLATLLLVFSIKPIIRKIQVWPESFLCDNRLEPNFLQTWPKEQKADNLGRREQAKALSDRG